MIKTSSDTRNVNNQDGIAIIMVMTSITFLILILATFTYDMKVNKIRLYNQQERLQARLNAEAGLKFALLRLEIYQKARNLLEKNKSIKDVLSPQLIQSILIMPFFYPIPPTGNMNIIQSNALHEFNDSVLLAGQLNFSIQPVTGFLNPNNMITHIASTDSIKDDTPPADADPTTKDKTSNIAQEVEKSITQILTTSIEQKSETDELFNSLYSNLNPELLVKELKYYVTAEGQFKDQELAQIQPLFDNKGIEPKFAPLSSIEELNLLPSWDDDIINLIKDNLTVHSQSIVNIELITKKQLMAIFPTLTDTFADDFFEYKNGDSEKEIEPHEIKSVAKFEQVLTATLSLIQPEAYKKAVDKLKEADISLGVANLLFEVTSTGTYNRAKYQLKAIINIPTLVKEVKDPNAPKDPTTVTPPEDTTEGGVFDPDAAPIEDNPNDPNPTKTKKEIEYLTPRIEEIQND